MTAYRATTCCATIFVMLAAAGCMPSKPVLPRQLDEYWQLQPDIWPEAQPASLSLGQRTIPGRWIFRNEPDTNAARQSIDNAIASLKSGTAGEVLEVGVSSGQWAQVADVLAQARKAISRLAEIEPGEESADARQWAEALADAILSADRYIGIVTSDGEATDGASGGEAFMPMLIGLLNEQSAGSLFGDLGGREEMNLRLIVVQSVLRLGFGMAGKSMPPYLPRRIMEDMPNRDREALEQMLIESLADAPPAPSSDVVVKIVRGALEGLPIALRVAEAPLRQWDRVEYAEVEYRRTNGQSLVSVVVKTRPGMQLELKDLHFMQPSLSLRGAVRATVMRDAPTEQSISILIEPLEEKSGARMEMHGLVWALVRLFAAPIAGGDLRQITVWNAAANTAPGGMGVKLLMLTDGKDPRRVLSFSRVRQTAIRREIADVGYMVLWRRIDFAYVTPGRLYYYTHLDDNPGADD